MLHKLLAEEWMDYDNRKIRDGRDASKISCDETWELDYIIKKLQKHYPQKTEFEIRSAMSTCCSLLKAPRNRTDFMQCVTSRLS